MVHILKGRSIQKVPNRQPKPVHITHNNLRQPTRTTSRVKHGILGLHRQFTQAVRVYERRVLSTRSRRHNRRLINVPLHPVPYTHLLSSIIRRLQVNRRGQVRHTNNSKVLSIVRKMNSVIQGIRSLTFRKFNNLKHTSFRPTRRQFIVQMSTRFLQPLPLQISINFNRNPQMFSNHVRNHANRIRTNQAPIQIGSLKFRPNRSARNLYITLRTTSVTNSINRHALPIIPRQQIAGIINRANTISRIQVATRRYTSLTASLNSFRHVHRSDTNRVINANGRGLTFHTRTPRDKQVGRSHTVTFRDHTQLKFKQLKYPPLLIRNTMTLVTRRLFPVRDHFRVPDVNARVNHDGPSFPGVYR